MPYVTLRDGSVAHVKLAKPRRWRCVGEACHQPAGFQCDYQVATGKTCNAWCCREHATKVGTDIDHCPMHAGQQAGLFTGLAAHE